MSERTNIGVGYGGRHQASRFIGLGLSVLVLSTVSSIPVFAENVSAAWLDRMGDAVDNLSYQGQFVHMHDGIVESLRIFHRVDDSGVRERLYSLDGLQREIVRDNNEIRCILPEDRMVVIETRSDLSALRSALPVLDGSISSQYQFSLLGQTRAVERQANVIAVKPHDRFRYGYRLWLDRDTAMPLRSELVNSAGLVLERVVFTEFELSPEISDQILEPQLATTGFQVLRVESTDQDKNTSTVPERERWVSNQLPQGFKLSMAQRRRDMTGEGGWAEHYVFSDGLATVSAFIETSREGAPIMSGLQRRGSANAYSVTRDGYQIVVLGEVPSDTVRLIASSLQPNR